MGDAAIATQTQPPATPPAPTVSPGGTARDFGNMLNAYVPRHVKKKRGDLGFSPWTKMAVKQEKLR